MDFTGLTITVGCPGSGKSTWADTMLPVDVLRLERDRVREAIFGSRRAYHNSDIPIDIRSDFITAIMQTAMKGWPHPKVAVTDTGLKLEDVQPFIEMADAMGLPIRLMIFERDPSYLLSCNRIREAAHRVPEDILLDRIDLFFAKDAWWRAAPFETTYVTRSQTQAA